MIELVRVGKVRRAKLYYLRDRIGKAAKTKENVGANLKREQIIVKEEAEKAREIEEEKKAEKAAEAKAEEAKTAEPTEAKTVEKAETKTEETKTAEKAESKATDTKTTEPKAE